jgi:hypothetical protein
MDGRSIPTSFAVEPAVAATCAPKYARAFPPRTEVRACLRVTKIRKCRPPDPAAVNGESVQPASLEAKQLFEIVEGFHALPQASAWELLVSREPRLAELESETRRGAFTRAVPVIRKSDPVLQHMARQRVLAGSELGDRLRELVGPRAAATDPLITSRAAFESALAYLASVDEAASQ